MENNNTLNSSFKSDKNKQKNYNEQDIDKSQYNYLKELNKKLILFKKNEQVNKDADENSKEIRR